MRFKKLFSLAIFLGFLQTSMAQWKLNDQTPIPVSTAINFQSAQLYATDDDANSYYVWSDYRTGVIELYVQKFDSRGVAQWQKDGLRIGNVLGKYDVLYSQRVIRPDGQGGAFVGWHLLPDVNNTGHRQFYAQHVSKDGKVSWAEGGKKITDMELWTAEPYDDVFDIVNLGNNQLLVLFNHFVGATGTNTVYTKKIDFDGNTIEDEKKLFENNRIEDKVIYDAKNKRFLAMIKDNQADYVFQTFNADNTPILPNPIAIYQNPVAGNSRIDLFKVDNAGNAVIGRTLSVDDGRKFVYGHKVDINGKAMWGANGINLGSDRTFDIQIVPTSDGGGIATWVETASQTQPFKIAKITSTGTMLWDGDVFSPRSDKPYVLPNKLEPDGKDGVYTLWLAPKAIGYDLTVQHFDNVGQKRFGTDGISIKDFTYYSGPRVIPYPKGGVIVYWGANKEESDGIGYTVDLYTNYITETGRFGLDESPVIALPPLEANKFCAGQSFAVSFILGGSAFSFDNTFKVLLSDKDGSFANATEIGKDSRTTINVRTPQTLEKGTYKIKVVSSSPAVESSNTIDIVIDEAGAPVITADKLSNCAGEVFTLTATGCDAGTVKWSNSEEGRRLSIALENAATFTAVCSVSGCKNSVVSNEVALQVTKVTATASNTGPFYIGESIKLSSSGGTKYAWTGPDSFTSSEQNPTILNAALAMGGVYSVLVTDANNCTGKAETTVLINNVLGIEKEVTIRTFPNPTSHEVIVEFYALANNMVDISLIDMRGAVVGQRKIKAIGGFQQELIDIRHFTKGRYLIKVNTAKQEVIKKIIVEN